VKASRERDADPMPPATATDSEQLHWPIEKALTPDVVYSALAQIGGGSKTLLASSCTSRPKHRVPDRRCSPALRAVPSDAVKQLDSGYLPKPDQVG
jgi:hypothetical protein